MAEETTGPSTGSVALVTGASGGIGKDIARQLVAAGLHVYLGARDAERGAAVVAELGHRAELLLLLDVTDDASRRCGAAYRSSKAALTR